MALSRRLPFFLCLVNLLVLTPKSHAQCYAPLSEHKGFPVATADGWNHSIISQDELAKPRSILLDSQGNVLILDSGVGLKSFKVVEWQRDEKDISRDQVCLREEKMIVENSEVSRSSY